MSGPDAVARLFGVGLLWMAVHCAGMCGPLLLGLDVGGARAGTSALEGARRTLLYQLGKACSYAVVGAVAGALGAGLAELSTRAGGVLAIAFGAAALVHALGLRAASGPRPMKIGAPKTTTERLLLLTRPLLVSRSSLRPFLLGSALAFLPCMISLWALGLAAMTSSATWGALVMLSLALATTPLLLVTTLVGRGANILPARARAWLPRVGAGAAGAWLVLVGLAGLEVIPHAHASFSAYGRSFVVMFF